MTYHMAKETYYMAKMTYRKRKIPEDILHMQPHPNSTIVFVTLQCNIIQKRPTIWQKRPTSSILSSFALRSACAVPHQLRPGTLDPQSHTQEAPNRSHPSSPHRPCGGGSSENSVGCNQSMGRLLVATEV